MKGGRFKVVVTAWYEPEWERYAATPEEAAQIDARNEPLELLELCEDLEMTITPEPEVNNHLTHPDT